RANRRAEQARATRAESARSIPSASVSYRLGQTPNGTTVFPQQGYELRCDEEVQHTPFGTEGRAREISIESLWRELVNVEIASPKRVTKDAKCRRHDVQSANGLRGIDQQRPPARLEHPVDLR